MKKLFILLPCVCLFNFVFPQTRELPDCDKTRQALTSVQNSFDNIVEKFKSKEDKISLVKTYFSDFSICGEKGKIKDYGRNVEFIFIFSDAYYKGDRSAFRGFYKKIFRKVKDAFSLTHTYKVTKEQYGKSSFFYEKGKEMTSSKRNIKLLLSYKDPVDETTTYSVSLVFEYYPKR